MSEAGPAEEDALLLLRMAEEAGGRMDPARLETRRRGSYATACYELCKRKGWIDGDGWITIIGNDALASASGGS